MKKVELLNCSKTEEYTSMEIPSILKRLNIANTSKFGERE